MRSIVALKNKATEGATNWRDRHQSHSSGSLSLPDPYHSRKQAGSPRPVEHELEANDEEEKRIDWANLSPEDKHVFFSWLDEFFARPRGASQRGGGAPIPPPVHQRTPSAASSRAPIPPTSEPQAESPKPRPQRPLVPATNRWSQASTSTSAPTPPPPRRALPAREPSPEPEEVHEDEDPAPPPPSRARFTAPPPPVAPKPPPPAAPKPRPPVPGTAPTVSHAAGPNGPPPPPLAPKPPSVNMASKPARPAAPPPPVEDDDDEEDDWCVQCRDFSAPDEHATYFPRQNAESVAQLAYDLTAPFEDEVDKARVLFTWFHHNVAYDAANFLAGTVKHGATPEDTLRTGMAVCEGYAGLFQALADAVGLGCMTISGGSKGYGYKPPTDPYNLPPFRSTHAWNAVWVYGAWRLVEPTWGAGALHNGAYLKRFAPIHFCPGNREFGRKHFPTDPSHQIVEPHHILSWEQFLLMPERAEILGDMEKLGYNERLLRPSTRDIPAGNATIVLKRGCNHLPETEADSYVPVCLVEWTDGRDAPTHHRQHMASLELRDPHVGWTLDVSGLQRGHKLKIAIVKVVNGQDALGYGRAAFERARGRVGMSWSYLAYWTVV